MLGWMDFSIVWGFLKVVLNHVLILVLYVDDLFLTGNE